MFERLALSLDKKKNASKQQIHGEKKFREVILLSYGIGAQFQQSPPSPVVPHYHQLPSTVPERLSPSLAVLCHPPPSPLPYPKPKCLTP